MRRDSFGPGRSRWESGRRRSLPGRRGRPYDALSRAAALAARYRLPFDGRIHNRIGRRPGSSASSRRRAGGRRSGARFRKTAGREGAAPDHGHFRNEISFLNALFRAGRADLAYALVDRGNSPAGAICSTGGRRRSGSIGNNKRDTYTPITIPCSDSGQRMVLRLARGHPRRVRRRPVRSDPYRPQPVRDLAWVKARILTVRGEVRSEWRRGCSGSSRST